MDKRFEHIESIYHAALERPDEQRTAWRLQMCNGDAELLAEVRDLLAQHERDSGLLHQDAITAAAGFVSSPVAVLQSGTKLSHFEIIAPAGRGGMGQVYRARDTRLNRFVAIKVLGPELIGEDISR